MIHFHAELDVLGNGQPGEKTELLEDENAVCTRSIDQLVIYQNMAVARLL